MNALLVLDYAVWKLFVTRSRPSWFRLKPVSILSLLYVGLFPLPRKFLLHYFRGKGNTVKIDTRNLVLQNPRVLASLKNALNDQGTAQAGSVKQRLFIGQHLVNNPNHRYSVGSLQLIFAEEEDTVHVSLEAKYRFSGNNNRVTKYLHQWLNRIRDSGAAATFNIEGSTWTVSRRALVSSEISPRHNKKYIDYNILYI